MLHNRKHLPPNKKPSSGDKMFLQNLQHSQRLLLTKAAQFNENVFEKSPTLSTALTNKHTMWTWDLQSGCSSLSLYQLSYLCKHRAGIEAATYKL